jgi:hypothetical protein
MSFVYERGGQQIMLPPHAVFIINNGPKSLGARFRAGTHADIRRLLSQFQFTTIPRNATHALVPEGVHEIGEKLKIRAPLLDSRVILSMDELWPITHKASAEYPAIRPIGAAAFLDQIDEITRKPLWDPSQRLQDVKVQDLYTRADADVEKITTDIEKMMFHLPAALERQTLPNLFLSLQRLCQTLLISRDKEAEAKSKRWWVRLMRWKFSTDTFFSVYGSNACNMDETYRIYGNIQVLHQLYAHAQAILNKMAAPTSTVQSFTNLDQAVRTIANLQTDKVESNGENLAKFLMIITVNLKDRIDLFHRCKQAWTAKAITDSKMKLQDWLLGLFAVNSQTIIWSQNQFQFMQLPKSELWSSLQTFYAIINQQEPAPSDNSHMATHATIKALQHMMKVSELKLDDDWKNVLPNMEKPDFNAATQCIGHALDFEKFCQRRRNVNPKDNACLYLQMFTLIALHALEIPPIEIENIMGVNGLSNVLGKPWFFKRFWNFLQRK